MSAAYPPRHYDEPRRAEHLRLMRERPLATFVVADDAGQPYVTPVPLVLAKAPPGPDAGDVPLQLLGHLDANNPAAAWVGDGRAAVAVFHGRSAYISPDDYHSRQLPTYNYEQVHVHGTLERVTDPARVTADLHALVVAMEGPDGWRLRDDDARVPALLPHVVAFRLHVERVDGRYKLSQDKRADDRAAADEKLARSCPAGW